MTWFSDWAMKHCVAFGFQGQHAETVLAWEAAFTLLFSDAELYEATATLVSRVDTKSFPGDQRGQIIAAIETTRATRCYGVHLTS